MSARPTWPKCSSTTPTTGADPRNAPCAPPRPTPTARSRCSCSCSSTCPAACPACSWTCACITHGSTSGTCATPASTPPGTPPGRPTRRRTSPRSTFTPRSLYFKARGASVEFDAAPGPLTFARLGLWDDHPYLVIIPGEAADLPAPQRRELNARPTPPGPMSTPACLLLRGNAPRVPLATTSTRRPATRSDRSCRWRKCAGSSPSYSVAPARTSRCGSVSVTRSAPP